jgi:hypothetical protein
MPDINTDIRGIKYTDRYRTDEKGRRWVMLEQAKIEIKSLEEENEKLKRLNDSAQSARKDAVLERELMKEKQAKTYDIFSALIDTAERITDLENVYDYVNERSWTWGQVYEQQETLRKWDGK